jgi:hypothetical protein
MDFTRPTILSGNRLDRPVDCQVGQNGSMHKSIHADLNADPTRVRDVLGNLEAYPDWLDIVTRADRAEPSPSDAGPAWVITLRAKVGPLARSKRLRMSRVINEPGQLRFERSEVDGRDHAAWVLDVAIQGNGPCSVIVDLAYNGGLWSKPLETILGVQIDDAVPRLQALVAR